MSEHLLGIITPLRQRLFAFKRIYHLSASLNEKACTQLERAHSGSCSDMSTDEKLIKGNMCVSLLCMVWQLSYVWRHRTRAQKSARCRSSCPLRGSMSCKTFLKRGEP